MQIYFSVTMLPLRHQHFSALIMMELLDYVSMKKFWEEYEMLLKIHVTIVPVIAFTCNGKTKLVTNIH